MVSVLTQNIYLRKKVRKKWNNSKNQDQFK